MAAAHASLNFIAVSRGALGSEWKPAVPRGLTKHSKDRHLKLREAPSTIYRQAAGSYSKGSTSEGVAAEAEESIFSRHGPLPGDVAEFHEEESLLFRYGPQPGDVAEVEAFCRIYRLAEQLHEAIMEALRSLSGEERDMRPTEAVGVEGKDRTAGSATVSGDVSAAEERVVAGIARIGVLLRQGRATLLGCPGSPPSVPQGAPSNESLPPLPKLRMQVKEACLTLQEALQVTLPEDNEFTPTVKERLESLKTVCLDAGFPRIEGVAPAHADIPNFAEVRLRTSRARRGKRGLKAGEDIAFYRGGQFTENGLRWLEAKGFQMVVDLRGWDVGNQWITPAVDELAKTKKMKYVRIPIDFGSTPTMEQVELFAKLVDDKANRPLYLHSQGGVGRACAVVSRWREFVLRGGLKESASKDEDKAASVVEKGVAVNGVGREKQEGDRGARAAGEVRDEKISSSVNKSSEEESQQVVLSRVTGEGRLNKAGDSLASDGEARSSSDTSDSEDDLLSSSGRAQSSESGRSEDPQEFSANGSGIEDVDVGAEQSTSGRGDNNVEAPTSSALQKPAVVRNALEAQRISANAFSKRSMSDFMRTKKATASLNLLEASRQRLLQQAADARARREGGRGAGVGADVAEGTLTGPAGRWGLAEPGIPRAGAVTGETGGMDTEGEEKEEEDEDWDETFPFFRAFPTEKGEPSLGEAPLGEAIVVEGSDGELTAAAMAALRSAAAAQQKKRRGALTDLSFSDNVDKSGAGVRVGQNGAAMSSANVTAAISASGEGADASEESDRSNMASLLPSSSSSVAAPSPLGGNGAAVLAGGVNGSANGNARTSGSGSGNGALFKDESEDVAYIQGDMCASTTGVVRLQSRRKAEMYLVRTDGFSCTREKVKESTLAFTHPSTQQQMLMWKTPPKTCLLLKKLGDELMDEAQQVASWLHHQEGINVVVEPELHDRFARIPGFGFVQTYYNQDTGKLHERVDFVVCLGGDGVILHASNLFASAVPPVVSFNLGSLGFLTAHPFEGFKHDLRSIISGNNAVDGVYITLRMRLRCELFRNGKPMPGKVFDVLNEVVVDRGSNPYLSKIECYERNRLITKVQADGVMVATPTGSTAYSTAAGGSMVHPNVPCMLFTPICPHSLSFRPVILPDSALFELRVPTDARNNAWVSFDGKKRQQLSKGDSVRVRMSEHPMPTINKSDQTDDWFRSLVRCLSWNERLEQKALILPS